MAERNSWVSNIPQWWPVGVGVVLLILAIGETRWTVQNHVNREEARQAEEEKLQWKAIAELNKLTYRAETALEFHSERIRDLERSR